MLVPWRVYNHLCLNVIELNGCFYLDVFWSWHVFLIIRSYLACFPFGNFFHDDIDIPPHKRQSWNIVTKTKSEISLLNWVSPPKFVGFFFLQKGSFLFWLREKTIFQNILFEACERFSGLARSGASQSEVVGRHNLGPAEKKKQQPGELNPRRLTWNIIIPRDPITLSDDDWGV